MNNIKEFFIRILFGIARRLPVPVKQDKLLVVRLDGIGDYILFRNCLRFIKKSPQFSQIQFTFLGNRLWKDLAEFYDRDLVEEFIWISPGILTDDKKWPDRLRLFITLKLKGFSGILHPVHSRLLRIDDFLSGLKTPQLIGSEGDDINYQPGEKNVADKLYTRLIPVPDNSVFEFFRNTLFSGNFTGNDPASIALQFEKFYPVKADEKFIIITPGAGHTSRQWPPDRFEELIRMLTKAYPSLFIYICGSDADNPLAATMIQNTFPGKVKNYCGKLSLPEFAAYVKLSELLISNESGPVHIAAASNAAAVCISNGNMFGRFNPYPQSLRKNIETVYADPVFYKTDFFESNVEKTKRKSDVAISAISEEEVFRAVDKLMSNKNN